MGRAWFSQDCPARGPALSHAHWDKCVGIHPAGDENEGNEHPPNMCCHCQMTEEMEKASRDVMQEAREQYVSEEALADHEYVWTLAGRCGRCQLHPLVHPTYRKGVPEGECAVDHNSIRSKQLIGDAGLQWSQCPQCGMMVEPKHITGNGPVGSKTARGRGDLTKRQMQALVTVSNREAFLDWLGRGPA